MVTGRLLRESRGSDSSDAAEREAAVVVAVVAADRRPSGPVAAPAASRERGIPLSKSPSTSSPGPSTPSSSARKGWAALAETALSLRRRVLRGLPGLRVETEPTRRSEPSLDSRDRAVAPEVPPERSARVVSPEASAASAPSLNAPVRAGAAALETPPGRSRLSRAARTRRSGSRTPRVSRVLRVARRTRTAAAVARRSPESRGTRTPWSERTAARAARRGTPAGLLLRRQPRLLRDAEERAVVEAVAAAQSPSRALPVETVRRAATEPMVS